MDKAEAIERLEYLKIKAQIALEQEAPEWIAEDVLGTIEAYDMAIEALEQTENSSEKPNNCEHITEDGVTCAKYPACDDCLDNPLNKVKGSERLVKGSEQTDCQTCKWWSSYGYCVHRECKGYEPQTDCPWK